MVDDTNAFTVLLTLLNVAQTIALAWIAAKYRSNGPSNGSGRS